jgi:type I restriction enzyme, S subunit
VPEVITNDLDLWISASLNKSTAGRGGNGEHEAYGIKKLRELILELAVRGKLVPHDSNDEPASKLLERTIAERTRLIQERELRDAKPPAFPVEPPDHELPGSWVWTNLYAIGEIAPRNEVDDSLEASFIPMQAISEEYGVPVQHEVRPWGEIKSGFTHFREEDVVLAKITPCFQNGKSTVMRGLTNGFGAGTTELHVYRSVNGCTVPEYVLIYLKSPRFIGDGIPKMTGTAGQKRITRDYFAGNHFPLPPLAEQHRIVAKVDELMALCNQLERQHLQNIEVHQGLVDTVLGTLTRVMSLQDSIEAWTRIADHFDTLFTTEHSIDQLKRTILQLAVMGKLVRQDSRDESASALLERIKDEKRQLIQTGRIREKDTAAPVSDDACPFEMPPGWKWVRLSEITRRIHYGYTASAKPEIKSVRLLRITDIQDNVVDWPSVPGCDIEESVIPQYQLERGDILVARTGGTVGKTYLVNEMPVVAVFASYLIRIQGTSALFVRYLKLFLESPTYWEQLVEGARGGAQPNVNGQTLGRMVVPLPPEAEQHRIVSKVDELMNLCDALHARLAEGETTLIHLANAIVERAVA